MQVGSLVIVVEDCSEAKADWPMFNYPNLGEIYTVAAINPHPVNPKIGNMIIVEERHFGFDGLHERVYREIQPPMSLAALLEETEPQLIEY